MFFPTAKQVDNVEKGEQIESQKLKQMKSVQEHLEALTLKTTKIDYSKTEFDRELEQELQQVDKEVAQMIEKKKTELSFEVLETLQLFPEIDQVDKMIAQAVNSFTLLQKCGKKQEAADVKRKIKEMKFHRQHLVLVMNLDFDKPTQKMID